MSLICKYSAPVITWLLPAWFHGYFFFWLFAAGFYRESAWMTGWAIVNLLAGFFIHLRLFSAIQKNNSYSQCEILPLSLLTRRRSYK